MGKPLDFKPIWASPDCMVARESAAQTEIDVIHRFLHDLAPEHFSIANISIFEDPLYAIALLKRKAGIAPKKGEDDSVRVRVSAEKSSEQTFTLRYALEQRPRAGNFLTRFLH
ncbi:MAG: hypothetical protein V3U82_07140 [Robiginitomaculum sp.]